MSPGILGNRPRPNLILFSATIVLLLAWLFPRLYIVQTLFLTPIYLSAVLFGLVVLVISTVIRRDATLTSSIPSVISRDRHALRSLRFTTPAAWSAVITRQSYELRPPSFPPIHRSAPARRSSKLDVLFRLIKTHFILTWYERISPSPAFPDAVEGLIRQVLSDVLNRAETVDWPAVLVSRLLPVVTAHFQHYRSVEHLSSSSAVPPPTPVLALPLPSRPHPALNEAHNSTGGTALAPSIEEHLRKTLERILGVALPEKQRSEVVDIIVREIVLGAILVPIFDMLCDSDFWNKQIDERGGRYLHEQEQVDKFLSALSNLPNPSSTSPLTPSKTRRTPRSGTYTSSISAETSSRQFDSFLRSIGKLKTLGDARRLRADVERELRGAKLAHAEQVRKGAAGRDEEKKLRRARKYVERLEKARLEIDARIATFSGQQTTNPQPAEKTPQGFTVDVRQFNSISLYAVLADPSSLAYWLEHMDRRNRSRLVQYWLTIEGFKDPLEAAGPDSALESTIQTLSPNLSVAGSQTVREDAAFLYEMYFAAGHTGIDVPAKHRQVIENAAKDGSASLSPADVQAIKHAVFASQKAVYEQMAEEDWPAFKKSELYLKAVTDLKRAAPLIPPPSARANTTGLMSPPPLPPRATPIRPPPPPSRQFSTPVQSSTALLDVLSPTRPRPLLRQGSITPASSKAPSTTLSITPSLFDRPATESKVSQTGAIRKTSSNAGDIDRVISVESSGPSTPSAMPRRSSQLDFLISGGDEAQSTEIRAKLFGDDDDLDEGEDDNFVQAQRMEAIQAALNEIIASDNSGMSQRPESADPSQPKSMSSSMVLPAKPEKVADGRKLLASRSADNLKAVSPSKASISAPTSRIPSVAGQAAAIGRRRSTSRLSLSPEKAARHLFDDDSAAEDEVTAFDEDLEDEAHDVIQLAAPGDLQLSVEIAQLQDKIQELVQQDHLLDALIRQAELTGNQNEIRILRRSQSSVRREQRNAIFQKAQFEQQEEENRLVPGRTKVIIPSSIITEDGEHKHVVRYTVEVSQVSEEGQVMLGWVVARRYNEFWELDRALRDWAEGQSLAGEIREKVVEMPGKKLVPNMSAGFVESRRAGLERYLQSLLTSTAICDSPHLRSFLSRSPVPLNPASSPITAIDPTSTASLSNLAIAPHNIVKSLYKTMATSLDDALLGPSMLDMMYTTLSRQLTDLGGLGSLGGLVGLGGEDLAGLLPSALKGAGAYTPQWLKNDPMAQAVPNPHVTRPTGLAPTASTTATGGKGGAVPSPIQPMGGESGMNNFTGPICDLFIEIFDLKESNWLRRQAIVVILQQFLGSTIERKVRDSFRHATAPDSLDRILSSFQDTLFPNGERRPPSEPRTKEEMYQTRLRASRKLGMLIPDIAANMIGRSNARRAARRVFGALQDKRLNQHLVLCLMDEVLNAVFPPAR